MDGSHAVPALWRRIHTKSEDEHENDINLIRIFEDFQWSSLFLRNARVTIVLSTLIGGKVQREISLSLCVNALLGSVHTDVLVLDDIAKNRYSTHFLHRYR